MGWPQTPHGPPPAREVDGLAPWEGPMQKWEPPNIRPIVTQLCSHNGTVLKGDEAMRSMQRVRRRKDDRRRKQKRKAG